MVGERRGVLNRDDPEASFPQLISYLHISLLLAWRIMVGSVYENADTRQVLAVVVEVRLYVYVRESGRLCALSGSLSRFS